MTEKKDDINKIDEAPWAMALDEWHAHTNIANAADKEKDASERALWEAERCWQYYNTGRDIGGFAQSSLGSGREICRQLGRGIDWRY
jgi:hypothetical protein